MPTDQLDRDDLIKRLGAVITNLRAAGQPTGFRIIGAAALALRYFDRRTTVDIDAPEEPVLEVAVPNIVSPRARPDPFFCAVSSHFKGVVSYPR